MNISNTLFRRILPLLLIVCAMLGVTFAQAGTALNFNGSNQYVTMGAATSTLGMSNLTIECWFMRTGAGVTTSTGSGGVTAVPLVTKGRGESDGSNVDCDYFMGIDASGHLIADFETYPATGLTSGQNYPVIGTNAAIQNNVWYHAAATFDVASHTWKLYLNGTQVGTSATAVGAKPRYDSIQHFGIGTAMTSTGAAAGFFMGVIDEVRIWNVARSQVDIAAGMNSETPTSTVCLIGRYALNDASGTSAVSSVAGAPTGALMPTATPPAWVTGHTFTGNQAPVVTLTTPVAGATSAAPGTFNLSATASDTDGNVTQVEFLRDGSVVGAAFSSPYTFQDTNVPAGLHTYAARATDNGNAITTTTAVTVSVLTNPAKAALLFDGVNDYVTMGVAPALNVGGSPSNGLTLESWFRKEGTGITSTSGSGGVVGVPLFGKGRGESDGSNVDCNYFFGINAAGLLVADFEAYPAVGITSGQNYPITATNTPITNGVWHHAAVTYDGTISTWKLYLDGSEVGTATAPAGALPRYDSIQHFGIGASFNSTGVPEGAFAGRIDEVRVWNYPRSAAEIFAAKDYEIVSATGLIGRYGLNEGTGTTTANSVGSGAPVGTLTNGPIWVDGAPMAGVNAAPNVTLDAPLNGASAIYPYVVQFSATASDSDGSIAKIEFFVNGAKAGESLAAPFKFSWTPTATGSYAVTVRALDNLGAATTSEAATLTIVSNPNQPPVVSLNGPADNATVFGNTVPLVVNISDPEHDATTASFFGRETVPPTPGPDFSLVIIPDSQYYSQNSGGTRAALLNAQTQWIVDNRIAKNIAFVAHMGDITENGDNGGNPSEWINADTAMSILENPATTGLPYGIPYGIQPGNHDINQDQNVAGTFYNQYFGVSRFTDRSYYGGHYGTTNNNNYQLISAGGLNFIIIDLAYRSTADAAILDWADSLLKAYPERRAIINSHWVINTGDPATFGGQGQAIYDRLKNNPNLFLMLCGHVWGEGKRADVYQGRTVYSILSDYQGAANGGNGFMRILTFKPADNTIHVESYSPALGRAVNSSDGIVAWGGAYDLAYNMQSAVTNWTPLGTVGVPSAGTQATYSWSGLTADTPYEWYASVYDGINTTTTPAHRFSTSIAPTDISSQVSVANSSFVYNRATKLYTGAMTITNTSQSAISGPFVICLNNLTGGVALVNSNGIYNGYPHIDPSTPASLNPGESFSVPLKFSNPANAKINFTPLTFQ
jgi:hypothetical protein